MAFRVYGLGIGIKLLIEEPSVKLIQIDPWTSVSLGVKLCFTHYFYETMKYAPSSNIDSLVVPAALHSDTFPLKLFH